jgi:hypothetical protein
MKISILWDIMPCSLMKVYGRFGGTCSRQQEDLLVTYFKLVSCLAYFSTMNIEMKIFSETCVDFQLSIWRYIPEDVTLQCVHEHPID